MLIALCIVGYLLMSIITGTIIIFVDKESKQDDIDKGLKGIFWPLWLVLFVLVTIICCPAFLADFIRSFQKKKDATDKPEEVVSDSKSIQKWDKEWKRL